MALWYACKHKRFYESLLSFNLCDHPANIKQTMLLVTGKVVRVTTGLLGKSHFFLKQLQMISLFTVVLLLSCTPLNGRESLTQKFRLVYFTQTTRVFLLGYTQTFDSN